MIFKVPYISQLIDGNFFRELPPSREIDTGIDHGQ